MNYPQPQFPGSAGHPSPEPSAPGPRRHLTVISVVVIVCTAVLLGSILTIAYLANRDSGDDGTTTVADDGGGDGSDGSGIDDSANGGDGGDHDDGDDASGAEGDPEQVALTVVEIMYGFSTESPADYVCSDPGPMLVDLESSSEAISEILGDISDLVDEFTVMDSYEEGGAMQVEIGLVVFGTETSLGTVELVVEEGQWRACDLTIY